MFNIQGRGNAVRTIILLMIMALSLAVIGDLQVRAILRLHGPIIVNGDAGFTSASGVSGGNGSFLNPYLIQDLNITAPGGTGIEIRNTSAYFAIRNVFIVSSVYGMVLSNSTDGEISNSTLFDNQYGILLLSSNFTDVFNNNFVDNVQQANDTGGFENSWDNGYEGGGNYWSDHNGIDSCSGFNQRSCPAPDGIADRPYRITGSSGSWDYYPLVRPYYPDVTPPVWPLSSKLTAYRVTTTGLTLNWTAATDNSGVVTYSIFEGQTPIANVTADIFSYNVTGLQSDTTYAFRVDASDRSENLSPGPSLKVATPGLPLWFLSPDFWLRNLYLFALIAGVAISMFSALTIRKKRISKRSSSEAYGKRQQTIRGVSIVHTRQRN